MNKRANGEGSLRKRPDGRWEGRYTVGIDPKTGKRISKSVFGKTQAECKNKLRTAIAENRGPAINFKGDYTVGEWMWLWYETYSKPNIRATTQDNYENYIRNHIEPGLGHIKLKNLTPIQIQQFYNFTKENGRVAQNRKEDGEPLSNRTVRGVHTVLRQAMEQAVEERLINHNPCDSVRIPPKEKKEMNIIPPEQIGAYLEQAKNEGVLPIFYLELTAGLRRGELMALLWEDVDVEAKTISVSKSVCRLKGELIVTPPKTQNSIRTVAISQKALELLIEEHDRHPDNPILFPSPRTGTYWSPECIGRVHKKLLKNAGIDENVRFHDLRHTFATVALQSGIDVKTVSNMLGHYSAGFTLDTYTHVTDQMQKAAAQRMQGVMDAALPNEQPDPPQDNNCKVIEFKRAVNA